MTESATPAAARGDRRKARTRAALIAAGQRFIAEGRTAVPVAEITEAADVGIGSFYNYFSTKEELFAAALDDALDKLGDVLESLTEGTDDPAEVFATSFRITGRLHRLQPELSRVILNSTADVLRSPAGLAPRARRDIEAGAEAGRFRYDDLDAVMVLVAGSVISLAQRVLDDDDLDDGALTDRVTAQVLRLLGLTAKQADKLSTGPLPDGWTRVSQTG